MYEVLVSTDDIEELSRHIIKGWYMHFWKNREIIAAFEVVDVCRRIYQSKRYNHLYTHRGQSSIEYLKKYELYEYFSGLITRESNFKRKPDPETLQFLIKEHNINIIEALMIGDRDIDILATKNAGIAGCYYKSYPLYDWILLIILLPIVAN